MPNGVGDAVKQKKYHPIKPCDLRFCVSFSFENDELLTKNNVFGCQLRLRSRQR
jgi:hypothetical protein